MSNASLPLITSAQADPCIRQNLVGPCKFGCRTSAFTNSFTKRMQWHKVTEGTRWEGVDAGDILCNACYNGFRYHAGKRGPEALPRAEWQSAKRRSSEVLALVDGILVDDTFIPEASANDHSGSAGTGTPSVSNSSSNVQNTKKTGGSSSSSSSNFRDAQVMPTMANPALGVLSSSSSSSSSNYNGNAEGVNRSLTQVSSAVSVPEWNPVMGAGGSSASSSSRPSCTVLDCPSGITRCPSGCPSGIKAESWLGQEVPQLFLKSTDIMRCEGADAEVSQNTTSSSTLPGGERLGGEVLRKSARTIRSSLIPIHHAWPAQPGELSADTRHTSLEDSVDLGLSGGIRSGFCDDAQLDHERCRLKKARRVNLGSQSNSSALSSCVQAGACAPELDRIRGLKRTLFEDLQLDCERYDLKKCRNSSGELLPHYFIFNKDGLKRVEVIPPRQSASSLGSTKASSSARTSCSLGQSASSSCSMARPPGRKSSTSTTSTRTSVAASLRQPPLSRLAADGAWTNSSTST